MSNLFDRLVGWIAPEAAMRRARSRYALQALQRGYDGAKTGRLTSGWTTAGSDANAEIAMGSIRLRDRARDLVRNNPFAAKTVMVHASSLVGAGIRPRPKAKTKKLDNQVTDLWDEFSENCDADGRTTFYGIQTLMARSMVESGECLLLMMNRPSSFGMRVPLQLRVLECDHLDSSSDRELPGGGYIQQGIEFDSFGIRAAYWIYPRHPGSARQRIAKSVRIPATDILHLYDRIRPGQDRGVTWFAPALLRMRDLDDYDVSELVRKKMEACFVGFVTNAEPPPDTGGDDSDPGKQVEDLVPGMLEYLPPGRDIRFGQPASTSGYAEYAQLHNHAVAAGLGLTYELLTGDLSKVNYSSIRAGLIEFRRRVDAMQRQALIPQLCQPVWNRFLTTAQAAGLIGNKPIRLQWTPPRFEAVDPVKDLTAEILAVRGGLMSPQQAISRQGYDPDVVMDEFNEMYQIWDLYKIIVDIDARQTTKNGQQKPMETANAATTA